MSLPILLQFKKEATTQKFRIASLAYAVGVILIAKEVIPLEIAKAVFMADTVQQVYERMVYATIFLLGAAPSIPGYRTSDRELPVGVTIKDIEIKKEGNEK